MCDLCEQSFGKETLGNFCSTQKTLAHRKNIVWRGKKESEGVINARPPHFFAVSVFQRFEMSELRESVEKQNEAKQQIVQFISIILTLFRHYM